MNLPEPKHQILQSLGIFLAGLGFFIAGIAFFIWTLRPPAPPNPVYNPPIIASPKASDDQTIQQYLAGHKELKDLINNSEVHKALTDFAKESTKDEPVEGKKAESNDARP
jgi:hypothetical protein